MEFLKYKIGDVVDTIQTGKTPNTKEVLYFNGNIMWVTPADLKGQQFITDTEKTISDLAVEEKEAFIYKENTVLISCIGDIGKAAIVKLPLSSNQQITGVRVKEHIITPKFFYYWVKRNKNLLSFKANKVTIPILNNKGLLQQQIDIPNDLEYQNKVVFLLDSVQNLIDKRIESIRQIDQIQRSVFFKMFGDPVANSHGHKTLKLSNSEFFMTSGITPPRDNSVFFDGDIPWVKSTDINKQIIYSTDESISSAAIRETGAKIYPKNSVLVAMYGQGATRGKVALLGIDASANQACAVINSKSMSQVFLYCCLNYSYEYLRSLSRGANRDNLSLTELSKLSIIHPSKEKQQQFEILFYKLKSIESILNKSLAVSQEFFQAVAHNAFDRNAQIDEESIFKDLIKKLSVNDLKGHKRRLTNLLKLFDENRFDNNEDYTEAKNKLFELILGDEIEQKLVSDKINLQVK